MKWILVAGSLSGLLLAAPAATAERERAFDLWDWTAPCRDLAKFRVWAADLKATGFNRIEISAPWNVLEPRPGEHDLSFIADRLAVARSLGMGMRVRINSYYAGCTPAWLQCDRWRDPEGKEPFGIPSITDERFWARYAPLCTAIARRFAGEEILYSPFIGVHAELKWSEWWTYDDSSLALWRKSIAAPRPGWLKSIVGDAPLPERPPVPAGTKGMPDTDPATRAFIAFREECWREALRRFVRALREGDPKARVAVPLGESFRRGSAEMSNLDYHGLSRGACQVVHSYDFFWHAGADPWYAGASVAAFQGIAGLPACFELDGPNLQEQFRYRDADLMRLVDAALAEGAGLKVANYSYSERLPSEWPLLRELAHRAAGKTLTPLPPLPSDGRGGRGVRVGRANTMLLFVSKWANYCYREPTEWLHDAQFGAWHMLRERGIPVRIICEDNLGEGLRGYRGAYVAFSPPELMPAGDRRRLERLCRELPSVVELPAIPRPAPSSAPARGPAGEFAVTAPGLPTAPPDAAAPGRGWKASGEWQGRPLLWARGWQVVLGYPLAYVWLRGQDRPAQERVLGWALSRVRR